MYRRAKIAHRQYYIAVGFERFAKDRTMITGDRNRTREWLRS